MGEIVFALSNVAIFTGYLFIAFVIVPSIDVRLWITKLGGGFFFATCGLTHLELAVHTFVTDGFSVRELTSWHMLIIHTVQAVAVILFVTGLYKEFVKPQLKPHQYVAVPKA